MRVLAIALALATGALAVSGCGSTKKAQPFWRGAGGGRAIQAREIKAAQEANPVLSIFPTLPRTSTCLIPSGGITSQALRGTCETTIRWAYNWNESQGIVTFTERWQRPACPAGATCHNLRHHSWVVLVKLPATINGKAVVLATQTRGASPPQAND